MLSGSLGRGAFTGSGWSRNKLALLLESAKENHLIASKYKLTVSDIEVFEVDSDTFSPVVEVAVADVT